MRKTWERDWEMTKFARRTIYNNEEGEPAETSIEMKPTMWQTKSWWPHINGAKSMELLRLNKQELRHILQTITGFNHLQYHQIKVKSFKEKRRFSRREAACRVCQDEAETFWHIATDCEPLQKKMRMMINPEEGWRVAELRGVLEYPPVKRLINPPETDG